MVLHTIQAGSDVEEEGAEEGGNILENGPNSPQHYRDKLALIEQYRCYGTGETASAEYDSAQSRFKRLYGEDFVVPMTSADRVGMITKLPTDKEVADYVDKLFATETPMHADIHHELAKAGLLKNPVALLSFKRMMVTGHEPDFFKSLGDLYLFGTAAFAVPPETYAFRAEDVVDRRIAGTLRRRLGLEPQFSQTTSEVTAAYDSSIKIFNASTLKALSRDGQRPLAPETIWCDRGGRNTSNLDATSTVNIDGSVTEQGVGDSAPNLHGMRLWGSVFFNSAELGKFFEKHPEAKKRAFELMRSY